MSASAKAVALAEAVGGDIKTLTLQLQASQEQVSNLSDALDAANIKIQELTARLDAMSEPPP
jgi:hypothetical protein